jgi:hypothetical protein
MLLTKQLNSNVMSQTIYGRHTKDLPLCVNPIQQQSLEIWHESCYIRNWASHFTSFGDGNGTLNRGVNSLGILLSSIFDYMFSNLLSFE